MSDDKKTTIVGGPPEFFILHRPAKLPVRRLAIAAIIGSAVVLIFVLALRPSPSILKFKINGKPMIGAKAHYGELFPKLQQPLTELDDGVFLVGQI